jgi:hypothetical protein
MVDDQDLFERIWYAERDRKVDLGADLKLLNKPNSPVFSRSDNLLPWVALICLVVVGWRLAGWVGALASAASMIILMATSINLAVMGRLRKRSLAYALSGRKGFDELWAAGALSIRLKHDDASEIKGPEEDWRAFARQRLPKTKAERDE